MIAAIRTAMRVARSIKRRSAAPVPTPDSITFAMTSNKPIPDMLVCRSFTVYFRSLMYFSSIESPFRRRCDPPNATVGVRLYTKCGQPPGITMTSPADCRNATPPILKNVSYSCLRKCEVLTDSLNSAENGLQR